MNFKEYQKQLAKRMLSNRKFDDDKVRKQNKMRSTAEGVKNGKS